MAATAPVKPSQHRTALRLGLAVAGCWVVAIVMSVLSGQGTVNGRYLGNLSSLLFAPLFILLATAIGEWVLTRALRLREEFTGRTVLAAGLGLGAFSLTTLVVGCMAVPPTPVVWVVLVTLAGVLSHRTGALLLRLGRRIKEFWISAEVVGLVFNGLLVLIICTLVVLNILYAFVPPLEYDELEYHLAAPAKYVRAGRIFFISDNAYASFPANIEMLFLDAMLIRGGVADGFALGRLINVALGLLAACAAGACAAALFSRHAAVPAAAILYTWPRVNGLQQIAYVELGLMFYVGLALLAADQYHGARRKLPHLVLLGIVCGLAAGCKYPAALFVCGPAALWVLWSARRRLVAHGLVFVAVALATLSPWLIRNVVNTGNPVYPLLGGTLGGRTWSARKEARWHKAHSSKDRSLAGMWKSVRKTATGGYPGKDDPSSMTVLLAAFLPFALVRRKWWTKALILLLLTAGCIVAWLLLTHRIPRFIMPWLVPLVVLNAAGAVALARTRVPRVVLALAFVVLCGIEAEATWRVRHPSAETRFLFGAYAADALATEFMPTIPFINSLPRGSRTLFLGEARTLYYTGHIVAPVVFDENPLDDIVRAARTPEDIRDGLDKLGITHIYVNLGEIHRLQWSYAFRHAGRESGGYTALFENDQQRHHLSGFLAKYCKIVHPALPSSPTNGALPKGRLDRELTYVLSHHDRKRPPRIPVQSFVYEIVRGS